MRGRLRWRAAMLGLLAAALVVTAGCSTFQEAAAGRPLAVGDQVRLRTSGGCWWSGRIVAVSPDSLAIARSRSEVPGGEFGVACPGWTTESRAAFARRDLTDVERLRNSTWRGAIVIFGAALAALYFYWAWNLAHSIPS